MFSAVTPSEVSSFFQRENEQGQSDLQGECLEFALWWGLQVWDSSIFG